MEIRTHPLGDFEVLDRPGDRPIRALLDYVARILGAVVTERRPIFTRGSMFRRSEKSYRRFEAGYFPVSSDGTAVDIILAEVRFS